MRSGLGPIRPCIRAAPSSGVGSAQTAWIDGPAAPPAQAGAAEDGVRAGRYGPDRDCNHIDLPLGTGPIGKWPGRTAKKDALRRCITTMGHRHVRVRQRADRYAHPAPMQGEIAPNSRRGTIAASAAKIAAIACHCRFWRGDAG